MNSKRIKFGILAMAMLVFSHFSFGQGLAGADGSCEVSVACSSNENDYVKCSGKDCDRDGLGRSVTCDGVTTSC
jgi:hypothetical protein